MHFERKRGVEMKRGVAVGEVAVLQKGETKRMDKCIRDTQSSGLKNVNDTMHVLSDYNFLRQHVHLMRL